MNKLFILSTLFYFSNISVSLIYSQDESPKEIQMEKTIQDLGDVIHLAMPAAIGLGALIIGDKKGGWQFVKSFSANLALTYAIKYAVNKDRPEGATDGLAFPSGHTSVAFHSAAFVQRRYGWKYGAPSYLLAGFVAYSRLEGLNDRHDGWDVLGGIIVGIGSSYIFTTPYQKEHFEFSFSGADSDYLIGVKYRF